MFLYGTRLDGHIRTQTRNHHGRVSVRLEPLARPEVLAARFAFRAKFVYARTYARAPRESQYSPGRSRPTRSSIRWRLEHGAEREAGARAGGPDRGGERHEEAGPSAGDEHQVPGRVPPRALLPAAHRRERLRELPRPVRVADERVRQARPPPRVPAVQAAHQEPDSPQREGRLPPQLQQPRRWHRPPLQRPQRADLRRPHRVGEAHRRPGRPRPARQDHLHLLQVQEDHLQAREEPARARHQRGQRPVQGAEGAAQDPQPLSQAAQRDGQEDLSARHQAHPRERRLQRAHAAEAARRPGRRSGLVLRAPGRDQGERGRGLHHAGERAEGAALPRGLRDREAEQADVRGEGDQEAAQAGEPDAPEARGRGGGGGGGGRAGGERRERRRERQVLQRHLRSPAVVGEEGGGIGGQRRKHGQRGEREGQQLVVQRSIDRPVEDGRGELMVFRDRFAWKSFSRSPCTEKLRNVLIIA